MLSRNERICREIQRILGEALRSDFRDEAVRITLTGIEMSDDYRNADVLYSVVGTPEDRAQARKNLRKWSGQLRKYLGRNIEIKYLPALRFVYDESLERGARILSILDNLPSE